MTNDGQSGLLLGKYEVLERIGSGGMAEVFKARTLGPGGFAKSICIKRILPQFARDASFIQMLVSEASVTSRLQHANVVQVFDLEEEQGEYYIVMELVEGCDLLQALTHRARQKKRVDEGLVLFLMIQVARGLHYAHQARDEAGRPLDIVHRDVSPSNILLSKHGEVKLVDFGVARTGQDATQDVQRRAGALKGKLGYMSPEMVTNQAPTQSSDIFALGIVLWEALTLRRLFLGGSEVQTLLNVRDVRIETKLRRHDYVSPEVLAVIRHTLQRESEDRYPSAGAFGDALEDILFDRRVRMGPSEVAQWVEESLETASPLPTAPKKPSRATDNRPSPRPTLSADTEPNVSPPPIPTRPGAVEVPEANEHRSPWDVFSQRKRPPTQGGAAGLTRATFHLRGKGLAPFGPISYVGLLRMVHALSVTLEEEVSVNGGDWRPLSELGLPHGGPMGEETPHCIQEGPLNPIRLPQLIYECALARLTGVLKTTRGTVTKEIVWRNGLITDMRSNIKSELLARYLVDAEGADPASVDGALAHAEATGIRLGDALVERQVLTATQLARVLESQCRHRFFEIFGWEDGWYELSVGTRTGLAPVGLVEDPFLLLAQAIREKTTASFLKATFEPFVDRRLKIKGNARVDFARFAFDAAEVAMLQELTDGELLSVAIARLAPDTPRWERLGRLLFLLHQTDFIALVSLPSQET